MPNNINYFKTFCRISKAFGTTLGKAKVLNLIVESAIETMDGKAACLFLADEDKDIFMPVAQKGLSQNYLHASPVHAKKIVKPILAAGFLSFYDATTDPRLEHHEAKKAEDIASILTVPVIVKHKTIGILSLYTAEHRDFTAEQVEFLTALAEQGGIAIEHAKLLERIRNNSSMFLELATNINASLDIKQILHNLTENISKALGMKGATIQLLNSTTQSLDQVAGFGLSPEFLASHGVADEQVVQLALGGETVAITDLSADPRIKAKDMAEQEGIASMLCVPIKSKERIIGLLRLFSGRKRKYTDELLMLVNALALTGGLAIQNASMYMMLEDDMKELKDEIWSHRAWF